MLQKNLESMSDELLLKNYKSSKALTYLLGSALAILTMTNLYLTFTKGFNVLTVVPIALLPILVLLVKNSKNFKSEIEKRKSN
jgi:hypothetical protein